MNFEEGKVDFNFKTNIMRLTGSTTPFQFQQFNYFRYQGEIKYLIISGPGGYYDFGVRIANMARINDMHVIVDGPCMSACAMIALAAKRVTFLDKGVLHMHGPYFPQVPIAATLEELTNMTAKMWLDLVTQADKWGIHINFLKYLSERTTHCRFLTLEDQEDLDSIRGEIRHALVLFDMCQK